MVMEGLGVHLLKRLWGQEYEDREQRFQISAHDLQVWAFLLCQGIKVSVPRPLLPSDHDLESEPVLNGGSALCPYVRQPDTAY